MSTPDKESDPPPQTYRVGYKRPPVEHRFSKGRSGNPAGRPKGAANKPKIDPGFGMRAAEAYLREEAYRTVTVREGERFIELPAIQAVFRAMGVSAMKGNRFAQKTMAELITGLEQRDADSWFELFGNAIDYKDGWSRRISHCKEHGLPVPEPLPHPDDIILDARTGAVRIQGPQTEEDKKHFDRAYARRAEAQEIVTCYARKYRRARNPDLKAHYLQEWLFEQSMFDIINDGLLGRHKRKLTDRSYHPDASREGETLKAYAGRRKKAQG